MLLEEIAGHLEGLSPTLGPIFIGSMPPDPDEVVAIHEYGGAPPEYAFGAAGVDFETPGLQVIVRGGPQDYIGPRTKAERAYRALAEVETQLVGGTFYHWIHPQQAPFLLSRDDSERLLFVFNCLAQKEPSP